MIRIMIVEDEPPIQRSLKSAIESVSLNFKVIACAFNGKVAISMLQEAKPDVIFTDIRMPVMDGIQLMRFLSINYPGIITVVLSGYQEFEYVKSALQLNAFDYLLKPISFSALTALLEQISFQVNSRKEREIRDYLEAQLNGGEPNCISVFQNADFGYEQYLMMLLCAGSYPSFPMDYLIPARAFWEKINLNDKVKQAEIGSGKAFVFNGKSSAEKIVISAFPHLSVGDEKKCTGFLSSILSKQDFPVTSIVSDPISNIREIGYVSQLLRLVLNKKLIIGVSQTIFLNGSDNLLWSPNESIPIDKEIQKTENLLLLDLSKSDMTSFKTRIKDLIQSFQERMYSQMLVEKILKHIVTLCQYTVSPTVKYDSSNLELEINEAITNSVNNTDLFNNLWCIFEELFQLNSKNNQRNVTETSKLLLEMESFLQENVSQPITNTILSEKFGFVPSYLSKLFKAYKGMSPTEYLTKLRIERAKKLIKSNPHILSKQIAAEVGYSDPLYFSKIFKKETGVWLSEYKKLLFASNRN